MNKGNLVYRLGKEISDNKATLIIIIIIIILGEIKMIIKICNWLIEMKGKDANNGWIKLIKIMMVGYDQSKLRLWMIKYNQLK